MKKSSKKALTYSVGAHFVLLLVLGYVGIFPVPAQAEEECLEISLTAVPVPSGTPASAMPKIAAPSAPAARQEQARVERSSVSTETPVTNHQEVSQMSDNGLSVGNVKSGGAVGEDSAGGGTSSGTSSEISAGSGDGGAKETVPARGPQKLYTPKPVYPESLKSQGIEGRVRVYLLILEDGTVGDVGIKVSSGYGEMDQAAMDAVRKWKFAPAVREGGGAVACPGSVTVTFSLNDE